ncbi:MAG TPA: GMC family oxidoreductase [Thermoleophilaceae bacterium]|nr:GMC family oxidoreductase [Thermoleophilaceae bacterium]
MEAAGLTEAQRETLRAFCDTIVPSVPRAGDPDGFWARKASDLAIEQGVEQVLLTLPPELQAGLAQLLDVLAQQSFAQVSQLSREQILTNMTMADVDAAQGVAALTGMTLFLYYGAPDPQTGQNPNWKTLGYPGPAIPPVQADKAIRPLVPEGDLELEADVVVVGSGAGGGVVAGTLAQQGLKVAVLEAAGYFNESDFKQLELVAYQEMYWRGGPTPTADGNVSLQAGTTLGGGTTINWTNCLRTYPWVREQWASEFGLEGVDGPAYDAHLDAVLGRIGATDQASDLNGPQQKMKDGCERLGWDFRLVVRNVDLSKYSPEAAGYLGFGDPSGAKQSTAETFLRDAVEHDAEILVRTRAQRVLVENGRAAGVQAQYADPDSGRSARVIVRAPHVVVACGALETPALLLRSQIGGPAVGDYLRLHPALAIFGSYGEDLRAWWGAPHAGLSHQFEDLEDGYGFLIEGAQYTTAIGGSATPWTDGETHKDLMARYRYGATFIMLLRDHGHGRVVLDPNGEAAPFYSLADPLDLKHARIAIEQIIRLHEAAGAQEIMSLAERLPRWRRGDNLERFITRAQRVPQRAGGQKLFSAHQMGTARMGTDAQTSVANPFGELHDVKGVWIGDGSAFPTPSGTNPMVTIMALARRTAFAIADAAGKPVSEQQTTGVA